MKKRFSLLLFILLASFIAGCQKKAPHLEQKPTVLVSLAPYVYFVEKIAGETVKIETVIPAGVNPHLFEPTPRQVEEISRGQVWLCIGESFEKKISKVLKERDPNLLLVDLCQGIELLTFSEDSQEACCGHCHEEGKDRHIWLSPSLAKIQASTIAYALIERYPEHSEQYRAGLETLQAELDNLDEKISKRLEPLAGDAILVSHPAFGYFCKEYNLVQLSIEFEGKDPLPRQMEATLKMAQEHHVATVLTQAQYNNKAAELIAEKLHLPIYQVNPYSTDYLANLWEIATVISHAPTDH